METAALQAIDTFVPKDAPRSSNQEARATIDLAVARIVVEKGYLSIELTEPAAASYGEPVLRASWNPKPGRPKRDIVLPANSSVAIKRPMHAERRAKHLRAIAMGRKWLQELIDGKVVDADAIATRVGRSKCSVEMMISLAFVAPQIVEASVAGRLPRGIGITRLMDLPPPNKRRCWGCRYRSDQRRDRFDPPTSMGS